MAALAYHLLCVRNVILVQQVGDDLLEALDIVDRLHGHEILAVDQNLRNSLNTCLLSPLVHAGNLAGYDKRLVFLLKLVGWNTNLVGKGDHISVGSWDITVLVHGLEQLLYIDLLKTKILGNDQTKLGLRAHVATHHGNRVELKGSLWESSLDAGKILLQVEAVAAPEREKFTDFLFWSQLVSFT